MASSESDNTDKKESALVWDFPTRLFHWGLVIAVATSLLSEELGNMDIHVISGHVVLVLILFRIVWGLVGGKHARFADFVRGPSTVFKYVKSMFDGAHTPTVGHNPLGALSVIALIGILAVQVGTGLFSNDDILTEGPLFDLVSKSTSDTLTYYHGVASNALYILIALHLAAVAFYTFKGDKILAAMIFGKKEDLTATKSENDAARGNLVIAILVLVIAVAVAWYVYNY